MKSLTFIRVVCAAIFVCGIAGMIVSSIAGNNEGWVLTTGGMTAIAALVLVGASMATNRTRLDVFDEVAAERVEMQIRELAEQGASEEALRQLVRHTIDLAKGQQ